MSKGLTHKRLKLSIFVLSFLCFALSGVTILYYLLFRSNSNATTFYYTKEDVQEVCQIFELDQTDSFCFEDALQSTSTLETMLRGNFPIFETNHTTITHFTGPLVSRPSLCSFQNEIYDVGFCPAPSDCSVRLEPNYYTCTFLFPASIGAVQIYFDRASGQVIHYGIPHPSDS